MTESAAHRLRVREVIEETADSRSLVFDVPAGAADRFAYRPGQFLTLRIPLGDEHVARCYSLSSAPGLDEGLKVTVKRVAGGVGSNWLCDHARPGTELEVLPPAGTFTPKSLAGDLLLFAGGSGITPIMSIVRALLHERTGTAVLIYANRDERSVIFADELTALAARHPGRFVPIHLLQSVQGLPTVDEIAALARPFADRDAAYVCGPEPFMDAVTAALGQVGMSRDRVVLEQFRSLSSDPFAGGETAIAPGAEAAATVSVSLDGEHHELPWPGGTTLLDLLHANGVDAPFSCKEGACSACACRLVSGEVKMLRNEVLEEEDLAEGWVLGCQSVPITEHVEVTYDDN
ncbi:ferredoxin--NADP reductase [Saccharopolyspora hirsuta]|uniref:Ferredoxin--NADP reductase n=1 Tax=Saccharopolyspora hirsuta TaxID=1837 RepID=A0A5M7C9G5_SACHI|nr:ferredoxin--NADP reductase [Saccharopolyspora hirsuta]KAA5838030.1 ferredoxin--NADP reductase [Saccharopolyspora hirsuta]